jgi:3-oxoacyl-[acyl-carrier-protein] synthase II
MVPGWPDKVPVASVRSLGPDLHGRAVRLATALGQTSRRVVDELLELNPGLRLSVVVATSHGEPCAVSEFAEYLAGMSSEPADASARAILGEELLPAFLAGLGEELPGHSISAACASACVAVGFAGARIQIGICDACLVVSLDVLSRVAHAGFRQIGAMSTNGCRPFDRMRDGTSIGEAGTVILLCNSKTELPPSLSWAVRVMGFGQSCDARHPVEPSADGISFAIQRAIQEARLTPKDLVAIYWHGTGTIQNDRAEAAAASQVFGSAVPRGTSTKGVFGHTMGASASLSIMAAAETVQTGLIPHVGGLRESEFGHLNLVTQQPAHVHPGPVAVVSLGFGGINAALLIGELDREVR